MKKIFRFVFCFMLGISIQSFAQEEGANDEMMKLWMDYMTPGETHEMLAKDNGNWKTSMTMWMEPGAEPMKSEGTMTNEMILGGRYQKATFKGDFMGMPMEGMSLLAFDNATEEFYAIWIDNMGTGMMRSKGKLNPSTNMVEMKGTYVDPMTKTEEPFRETMKFVDENNQVMEMYMYKDGQEFKSMQIEFTRQ